MLVYLFICVFLYLCIIVQCKQGRGDGRRIKMVRYTNSVISTYLTSYTISLSCLQYKYYTNTTQIQHKYITNTTQIQHKYSTNTTPPTSHATLFPCSCLHKSLKREESVFIYYYQLIVFVVNSIFIRRGHVTYT